MSADPEKSQPTVMLGVTGSIAAYKAADLTSQLVQAGVDVHVIMTENATRLVQAQTFLTLSQNPVVTSLWDVPDWRPEHIALADRADLFVVAPATANFLAKYAHGIADDALSTTALSYAGPVLLAPAMNPRMWQHPATRENVKILKARGVQFLGPVSGHVACGPGDDPGRFADSRAICRALLASLAVRHVPRPDPGLRVLVTAGPTCEDLDSVRYLTNRSSGKMGYACAEAAAALGCEVTLISGPSQLPAPLNCDVVMVRSALEMAEAVHTAFTDCDVLIMSAAVADYRPAQLATGKIKKQAGALALELSRTEDILLSLGKLRKPRQILVGFAAETEKVAAAARGKLATKGLDWIVANDVSSPDTVFGSEQNTVTIYGAGGESVPLERANKVQVAAAILARVLAG